MQGIFLSANTSTAITSDMLEPVVDAIVENIAVVIPIGITVFGILIAITMVPRLLKKFTRG